MMRRDAGEATDFADDLAQRFSRQGAGKRAGAAAKLPRSQNEYLIITLLDAPRMAARWMPARPVNSRLVDVRPDDAPLLVSLAIDPSPIAGNRTGNDDPGGAEAAQWT